MLSSKGPAHEDQAKSKSDIERLEKVIGQLQGAHAEISLLVKKSPSDSRNKFKLNLINRVLNSANEVLGQKYRPFDQFSQFDIDDAPTTGDVTMIFSQNMEEAERYRPDNVTYYSGNWYYKINGDRPDIGSGAPTKVGRK